MHSGEVLRGALKRRQIDVEVAMSNLGDNEPEHKTDRDCGYCFQRKPPQNP